MKGSPPPNASLFNAKVLLVISTIYSTAFVILKELGQNLSFSVKSKVQTRGQTRSYM